MITITITRITITITIMIMITTTTTTSQRKICFSKTQGYLDEKMAGLYVDKEDGW